MYINGAGKQKLSMLIAFLIMVAFAVNLAFPYSLNAYASQQTNAPAQLPAISSDYSVLIDADVGTILFDKKSKERAYPASTTKVMTAILVIENCKDFEEVVTVGEEVRVFTPVNSLMGLKENEKVRVIDMLYGLMLVSGNDAAATLAIHFGGSIEGFADMMNAKAAEIGMTSSHFVNPHGLHNEDHYTTAYDMALLTQYAMKNEKFRKLVSTPDYTLPTTNKRSERKQIFNTNKFLTSKESEQKYHWKYVNGVKTGSTSAAQGCLVTSASKDGVNLICVTFHDTSDRYLKRWDDSRQILEYGFANLSKISLADLNLKPNLTTIVSNFSKKDEAMGELMLSLNTSDVTISGLKDDIESIVSDPSQLEIVPRINNGNPLVAPVEKDQVVGTAAIKYNETTLAVVPVIADRSIASVVDDTAEPTNDLIEGVIQPKKKLSPILIAMLSLLALALVLGIVLIFRKRRLTRMSRSYKRRKSGYYDYYKR